MRRTIHYLFDPLCGWCYGASRAVAAMAAASNLELRLLPSGLFEGEGARLMDDAFAAYASSNDQRIERLTGQPFSPRYRDRVLANREQRFDSGQATKALTAVWMTSPEREFEALKAFQRARFVDGEDITRTEVLALKLDALGLSDAADMLRADAPQLRAAAASRMTQGQALMRQFGARGVPSFVLEANGRRHLLQTDSLYSDPDEFVTQVIAA